MDQPIGSTWGYTRDMSVSGPDKIIAALCDTVSKNGNLLLNISLRADGTIPQEQQSTLLAVGDWLRVNGEAIYGTHAWTRFGEVVPRGQPGQNVRFSVKGDALYALILGQWPGAEATIPFLGTGGAPKGTITSVAMLGAPGPLAFSRDAAGLHVRLPAKAPCSFAYTLKIVGLKMNPSTYTASGNPDEKMSPQRREVGLNPTR